MLEGGRRAFLSHFLLKGKDDDADPYPTHSGLDSRYPHTGIPAAAQFYRRHLSDRHRDLGTYPLAFEALDPCPRKQITVPLPKPDIGPEEDFLASRALQTRPGFLLLIQARERTCRPL